MKGWTHRVVPYPARAGASYMTIRHRRDGNAYEDVSNASYVDVYGDEKTDGDEEKGHQSANDQAGASEGG